MKLFTIKDLTQKFEDKMIFDSLHLDIYNKTVIKSPNGGGKTTLLKILAGQLTPTSGTIELASKRRLVFIPSEANGFFQELTGQQNIELMLNVSKINPHAKCYAVFNESDAFQTALITKYAHCSMGMKQLLKLYVYFNLSDCIFLIDEPFNYLDYSNRMLVKNHLESFEYIMTDNSNTDLNVERILELGSI